MVGMETVSAFAVYSNLVNIGKTKVKKLSKNRRRPRRKKGKAGDDSPGMPPPPSKSTDWIVEKSNNVSGGTKLALQNGFSDAPEHDNKRVLIKKRKPHTSKSMRVKNGRLKVNNKSVRIKKKVHRKSKSVPDNNVCLSNSFLDGENLLSWVIHPSQPEEFFKNVWEKRPLHIQRHKCNYYSSLLSTDKIDLMLREHNVQFSKNLDVTSYLNGKRETHNPVGRAYPSVVWDYYKNGCSIRLLNPQTFIDKIWNLNAALQDAFGCFVGANVYLTPPDSQGFAPHYDDIEAFILQVEGKKHWKLYAPLSPQECLPRFSSKNFSQEEIGEPILDVVLEAGDLLYFPRGVIHQGSTVAGEHSLHITISTYQKNTWGDLLEKLVPVALQTAMEEDPRFREGLPRNYLRYMGVAHSDYTSEGRSEFISKVGCLMKQLFKYAPIDAAADQLGKQLMYDALPPSLSQEEKSRTVFDDGEKMQSGVVKNRVEMEPDTRIKLVRGNILRLVTEGDSVRIYHCVENSREYHAIEEPQFIEISLELAPGVEFLIHSYPMYVSVDDLPVDDLSEKMQLAVDLWEKGLVMTEQSLCVIDD